MGPKTNLFMEPSPFDHPSPSPTTFRRVIYTWNFTCGHSFTQTKDGLSPRSSLFGFESDQQYKSSSEKCPECVESESTKQKEIRESLRAKEQAARNREEAARRRVEEERNAAAKALERDAQALEVYRSQSSTIQQHIDNAADNEELRVNLQKMLENCKVLWAEKIKKAEISAVENPIQLQSQVFILKDRLEKVGMMAARARILLNQENARKLLVKPERMEKLERQFEEWTRVLIIMKKAMDMVEEKVCKELDEVEKLSNSAWEDAMKLMKEDSED
jgi:hypothetical protein